MTIEITTGGSLNHLTFAEYRAYEAVSQSDLKACYDNPQLYYEQQILKTRPKAGPSDAQQWGVGMEEYIKTGGAASDCILIPREVLSDQGHRRGKAWQEFAAEHEGKTLLTEREYHERFDGYESALKNIQAHECAKKILFSESAAWSQRFIWPCVETDLPLKGELDLIDEAAGIVCDVKTAADVDADSFQRAVFNFGYDIQAAHYLDAMRRFAGDIDLVYCWVVIRNKPPYNVEVYEASSELLNVGEERRLQRLRFFYDCINTGRWVTPSHGISSVLFPPKYMEKL